MNTSDQIIDLLRHGEPEGGHCFRGSLDDPLSKQGLAQLQAATQSKNNWDGIISSPLKRCADFAKALAEQHHIPLHIDAELRERHFGEWEGKQAQQIPENELKQFWQQPESFTPNDAEPFDKFNDRIINVWNTLKKKPHQNPLIITHGGVIRIIIGHILNLPKQSLILLEVPYANRSRIRLPKNGTGKASLVFHSDFRN